jgi:hypothetical protein
LLLVSFPVVLLDCIDSILEGSVVFWSRLVCLQSYL